MLGPSAPILTYFVLFVLRDRELILIPWYLEFPPQLVVLCPLLVPPRRFAYFRWSSSSLLLMLNQPAARRPPLFPSSASAFPLPRRVLPSSSGFTSLISKSSPPFSAMSSSSSDPATPPFPFLERCWNASSSTLWFPSTATSRHPLLGSEFESRQDATAAIKLYEYECNAASMRTPRNANFAPEGGSAVAFWTCATNDCTVLYVVRQRGKCWVIDAVTGEHVNCARTKRTALPINVLEQACPFSALMARQANPILSNVTPTALRAAGSQLGLSVSNSLACNLKRRNTKRLIEEGHAGYRHLTTFMQEVVRGNPGSKVHMRVKHLRPSAPGALDSTVSDFFSFSYTSCPRGGNDVITSGSLPPEDAAAGTVVFHSCVVIPAMSYNVLELSSTSHAMDFARLFQSKKADAEGTVIDDMQISVLSTELAGSDVPLAIGLLAGNESAHMWAYMTKILKADFPTIAVPATMLKTDRPFGFVRRMIRSVLGLFPSCCDQHLIRNVRGAVSKKEFTENEDKLYDFLYSTSDDGHRTAKAALSAASPKIMDILITSEYGQGVFSESELLEHPYYNDSYTLHAVFGHCKATGGTTPHYKDDAYGPATTSNVAERLNADMKQNGCRYQGAFLFFVEYLDRISEKYRNIFLKVSAMKTALLTNVHEVYRSATKASTEYEVTSRGHAGWRVVKRRLTVDAPDRRTNVNIMLGICHGRNCARVTFTREPCKHLICAYCDEGYLQDPRLFEKRWPKRFLRSAVLELFDRPSMTYTPPAMVGDEVHATHVMGPARKKCAVTKPGPGRPFANSTRWASPGDRGHFADTPPIVNLWSR